MHQHLLYYRVMIYSSSTGDSPTKQTTQKNICASCHLQYNLLWFAYQLPQWLLVFLCCSVTVCDQTVFFKKKYNLVCSPVPSPRGHFGGLSPQIMLQAPQIEIWALEISVFFNFYNVKPPCWKPVDGSDFLFYL